MNGIVAKRFSLLAGVNAAPRWERGEGRVGRALTTMQ